MHIWGFILVSTTFLMLNGCADLVIKDRPIRVCKFNAQFIIDEEVVINGLCHAAGGRLVNDNFIPLDQSVKVLGCTNLSTGDIYMINDGKVILHEIRHLIDWNCGIK